VDEGTIAIGEVMQCAMHRGPKEVEMANDRESRGGQWETSVFGLEKVDDDRGKKEENKEGG
jgi:hypothetical protein